MDCSRARVAISATLDGEPPGEDADAVAAHVTTCSDCRTWRESAHEITRRVRLVPAEPRPGASRALLAAVRGEPRRSAAWLPFTAARFALLLVALIQLALAVPALILGTDREAPLHIAHEMGSFDVALAVGFLIVAWQPSRAHGMHLLVGAAAALLVTTAVIDLCAGGRTSLSDEAPHLLVVVGWLLMLRLAAAPLDGGHGYGRAPVRGPTPTVIAERALDGPFDLDTATPRVERRAVGA